MFKLFVLLGLVAAGWYIQNNYDFSGLKDEAIEKMKQEKTINAVNAKRAADQRDINDVNNR
ncbi:MAG: hypothetical protein E7Z88_06555 [Cyanobacteria bacterium SIG27]|nr:hypothetical protein [Cyanobacteria bacterium SIG27]